MDQMIYALLATVLVALFALNMQRGIHTTEQEMVVNEVATQLTGVGIDVIEHIGRKPFDENTDESKKVTLTYPVITSTAQLTPEGAPSSAGIDGWGGCASINDVTPTCDDIDDFDGVSADIEVDGFTYTVDIAVQYVDRSTLNASGSQTYAKEVTLTISNPYLLMGNTPLAVDVERIFIYNRHTS